MNKTTIEWTDFTWNPVTGCHKVSPGCKNCYAETLTNRFAKPWGVESFRDIVMHEDRLKEPQRNKIKWDGKKVFVCSMSDLFQENVTDNFIWRVFQQMHFLPNVTFQLLTKRPQRASELLAKGKWSGAKNIWIGTSCENQETANERIPFLLQIPAAVRFLSCEPLLGPIDLKKVDQYKNFWLPDLSERIEGGKHIDWVITGGESGHNARPMHPDWVRSLRDQCEAANVPFLFKQWGEYIDNQNMPRELVNNEYKQHVFGSGYFSTEVWRVGKSKAGNLLDGKQHLEFPKV